MPYKDYKKRRLADNRAHKKLRENHKRLGLCHDCKNATFQGLSLCLTHYTKQLERVKNYRRTHKEEINSKNLEYKRKLQKEKKCYKCSAPLREGEAKFCVSCSTHTHNRGGVLKYETAD